MNIRQYQPSDYIKTNALAMAYGQNQLPEYSKMGGYGLIAEEDGKVEGFVWALYSPTAHKALIDYFLVDERRRDRGILATLLMSRMLIDLLKKGKNQIVGVIKEDAPNAEKICRLYRLMGMTVTKAYLVTGDSRPIIENMMQRFNGDKNGVRNHHKN